jgi:hypothetical protein
MDNYCVLWEVAKEWEMAAEMLAVDLRAAIGGRLAAAAARTDPIVGLGILLLNGVSIALWLMI